MSIYKKGTPQTLAKFVRSGKILLVKDETTEEISNLGAVMDLSFNKKALAWACSTISGVSADNFLEIRHREDDDYDFYEVELNSVVPLTLIFRNPANSAEIDLLKTWKKDRDIDGIKADLPIVLKSVKVNKFKRDKKYYFCYWTQYIHGRGLYPVGFVIASVARLVFIGCPGYEQEAHSWQRDFGGDVSGNPVEDLKRISNRGWQTSFSLPEPVSANDFFDAQNLVLAMVMKSKSRIDAAIKSSFQTI